MLPNSSPSEKLNPYVAEEDQDVEMKASVVGPGPYGSPDSETEKNRLLPLHDHPRVGALDEDYGTDHLEAGDSDGGSGDETTTGKYNEMTVEELKDEARDRDISGFSAMKKEELVKALEENDASVDDGKTEED